MAIKKVPLYPTTGARYAVQTVSSGNASSSSRTCTFATPTVGNLLVIVSGSQDGTDSISSIVQTNVSWSKLYGSTVGVAPVIEIWLGVISTSPGTGAVITYSGTAWHLAIGMEWENLTGTLNQSATRHVTNDPTGTHPIPILTPTIANALVVGGLTSLTNSTTYTAFTGPNLMFAVGSVQVAVLFGFPGLNPIIGTLTGGNSATATGAFVSIT